MGKQELTYQQKRRLKELYENNANVSYAKLGEMLRDEFKLSKAPGKSAVARILSKDLSEGQGDKERKRKRPSPFESFNVLLHESLRDFFKTGGGVSLDRETIREKARRLSEHQNVKDLVGEELQFGETWLNTFLREYGWIQKKRRGETLSANEDGIAQAKRILPMLLQQFDNDKIYNQDETAFLWDALPTRSYLPKNASSAGYKSSMRRITVSFCANATGTHKLRPQVIAHARKPKSLKNVPDNDYGNNLRKMYGIDYMWNRNSWQQASTFSAWLEKFKHQVASHHGTNCKVLLIIDGAGCHQLDPARIEHEEEVSEEKTEIKLVKYTSALVNMFILMLPPRATTSIQPMDQGIIYSWKRAIIKAKARWQINRHEQGKDASLNNATIAHALRWAKYACDQVDEILIVRAWQKCCILPCAPQQHKHQCEQHEVEEAEENEQSEVGQHDDDIVLQEAQEITGQATNERLSAHEIAMTFPEEDNNALARAPPTVRSVQEIIEEISGGGEGQGQGGEDSDEGNPEEVPHILKYEEALSAGDDLWNFAASKANHFSEIFFEHLTKVLDELDEIYTDPQRLKQKTLHDFFPQ